MPDLPEGTPKVGIIGGGQLARMSQQPAIALGVQLHVLADSEHDSASQVIPAMSVGAAKDAEAIRALADQVDVVTFDHEHVPLAIVEALEADGVAVYRVGGLQFAQDKAAMRTRLADAGFPVPRWQVVQTSDEVDAFDTPWPKSSRPPKAGTTARVCGSSIPRASR